MNNKHKIDVKNNDLHFNVKGESESFNNKNYGSDCEEDINSEHYLNNPEYYDDRIDKNDHLDEFIERTKSIIVPSKYNMYENDSDNIILENDKENFDNFPQLDSNFEEQGIVVKNPNVNILIDMDVANKSAVFIIEMPMAWNTKVYNRFKANDDSTLPIMNELNLINVDQLDSPANIDAGNQENPDRLNVEIEMSLCKENLNESEISANLNSRSIIVKRSSISNIGEIHLTPEDFETESDMSKLEPKFENKESSQIVKKHVERQRFQFERNSIVESNFDRPSQRFDFRFKLSEMKWPSFRSRNKSMNDVVNEDKELSQDANSNETMKPELKSFFQKFELPSICGKSHPPESDAGGETLSEIKYSNSNPNMVSDGRRFDFRYQLPKLELPSIFSKDHLPESETNIKTEIKTQYSNSDPNISKREDRFDFRYQLPKLSLDSFSLNRNRSSSVTVDRDFSNDEGQPKRFFPKLEFHTFWSPKEPSSAAVNVDDNMETYDDENAHKPTERFDFRYKLPKLKLPEMSIGRKLSATHEADENKPESPDGDININSPAKRFDFRYQFPKLQFPAFNKQSNNSNVNGDINVKHPYAEDDVDIEKLPETFDFQYQEPQFQASALHEEESTPDVDIDIKVTSTENDIELEKRPERFDFRYHLPKPPIPDFPFTRKSSNVKTEIEAEVDTQRFDFRYQLPKINFPSFSNKEQSTEVDENIEPSNESNTTGFDFKFKLPKIEFPIFGRNEDIEKSDEKMVEESQVLDVNVGPENNPSRFDFRYQLPKIEFPHIFPANVDVQNTSPDDKLPENDDTRRNSFKLQLPTFSLPSFSLKEKPPIYNLEFDYNIDDDPYLRSLVDDFDNGEEYREMPREEYQEQPSFVTPVFENPPSLSKKPSINLSRKVSNPFAKIYLDNMDAKRLKSFDLPTEDGFSSFAESRRRDWTMARDDNRFSNRGPLTSVDELMPLSFPFPKPVGLFGDEHSDIDLYPSPTRIIPLHNFSPLVSITTGSNNTYSASDVGSTIIGSNKRPLENNR